MESVSMISSHSAQKLIGASSEEQCSVPIIESECEADSNILEKDDKEEDTGGVNDKEEGTVGVSKNRKRKKNYCFHCKKLVAKFAEHLVRKHPETPEGMRLIAIVGNKKEKRLEAIKVTVPLMKKWNAIFNESVPAELTIPVKRRHSKKKNNEEKEISNLICKYCKGHYRRDKMSVHLKSCSDYLLECSINDNSTQTKCSDDKPPTNAIKQHSDLHIPETVVRNVTPEFISEILAGINFDNVIQTAFQDSLIMKFASEFHKSRRESASKHYVIREMRDLTKLFIKMQEFDNGIAKLADCFNPKHFNTMIQAALTMSGYTPETGVKVPSIAYRLCQPVKDAAKLMRKDCLANLYESGGSDRTPIVMIDDFLNMVESDWKVQIGRICRKATKVARVDRDEKMAVEEDIVKLAAYIEQNYRSVISDLETCVKKTTYNLLTHMIVSHIMLLVRRRPVDFKNATIKHFYNIDRHDELISMAGGDELDESQLEMCKRFHIFYVPGKNLDIVPMVLTPVMKKAMETLIKYRLDVGINSDTLFVLCDDKPIKPNESLKLMSKKVKLTKASHLTGNGLRHQAATFSRLHSKHPQYQDYLASMLGHTLSVHRKHYELPMSIIQKLTVCPILHGIMTGKKKNRNECTEKSEIVNNAANVHDNETNAQHDETDLQLPEGNDTDSEFECEEGMSVPSVDKIVHPKCRWTEAEQKTVFEEFGLHILNKIIPKRSEVVSFLKGNTVLKNRSVPQVLLFIRNHVKRKQLNVTPKVKRYLLKETLNIQENKGMKCKKRL